ncbi:MAG TPA: PqqD family protein [Gemmatimonadales bacterium]|jgi:coenzyme PQQ synthesis protein D (PqqD)|nr:PqqD family protein [Gemmatimonadales bacterium]
MPDRPTATIRAHVLTAHLQGEAVLLDLDTKRYYRLNSTAACIWKGLEQSLAPDQITKTLVDEFDVDPALARMELDRALGHLRARGLVT